MAWHTHKHSLSFTTVTSLLLSDPSEWCHTVYQGVAVPCRSHTASDAHGADTPVTKTLSACSRSRARWAVWEREWTRAWWAKLFWRPFALNVDRFTAPGRTTFITIVWKWTMIWCATSAFSRWFSPWIHHVATPSVPAACAASCRNGTFVRWTVRICSSRSAGAPASWCTSCWINCRSPVRSRPPVLSACHAVTWRHISNTGKILTLAYAQIFTFKYFISSAKAVEIMSISSLSSVLGHKKGFLYFDTVFFFNTALDVNHFYLQ